MTTMKDGAVKFSTWQNGKRDGLEEEGTSVPGEN